MSPRAACRLEQLGFDQVYDYAAGKNDWLAAALPMEGEIAEQVLVGALTQDVMTCDRGQRLTEVLERMRAEDAEVCVATTDDAIVLGRIRLADHDDVDPDDEATVEQRWEFGPTTVRASEAPGELLHRMEHKGVDTILVTDASGRLLGQFDRRIIAEVDD